MSMYTRSYLKNPKVVITCKKCGNQKIRKFTQVIAGDINCDCQVKSTAELFQQMTHEWNDILANKPHTLHNCKICTFKTFFPTKFELHTKAHQYRGEA